MLKPKSKMAKDFTLHHRIVRPISLHHHPPLTKTFHDAGLVISVIFIFILAWLLYLAYSTLIGAPANLLLTVILPIFAAIILFSALVYYRKTFFRELHVLKRRFKVKYEHSFKHS